MQPATPLWTEKTSPSSWTGESPDSRDRRGRSCWPSPSRSRSPTDSLAGLAHLLGVASRLGVQPRPQVDPRSPGSRTPSRSAQLPSFVTLGTSGTWAPWWASAAAALLGSVPIWRTSYPILTTIWRPVCGAGRSGWGVRPVPRAAAAGGSDRTPGDRAARSGRSRRLDRARGRRGVAGGDRRVEERAVPGHDRDRRGQHRRPRPPRRRAGCRDARPRFRWRRRLQRCVAAEDGGGQRLGRLLGGARVGDQDEVDRRQFRQPGARRRLDQVGRHQRPREDRDPESGPYRGEYAVHAADDARDPAGPPGLFERLHTEGPAEDGAW